LDECLDEFLDVIQRIRRSLIIEYLSEFRVSGRVSLLRCDRFGERTALRKAYWSSYKEQMVDALATGGDEGRG
jgi:hypothetical protein